MKHILIGILILLQTQVVSWAKREAPREIAPIRYGRVVITVPHFAFQLNGKGPKKNQNGGFLEAHDSKTAKCLWTVQLYQTRYDPNLERDVQDVFISEINLKRKAKLLLIKDESGRTFVLALDSLAFTQINSVEK